ncbi:TNF receptor-associated factor 1 isoform X2 [Anolis carolinensis]|uniref:TNF receptor-associated factor 1 isoform X2 n=1 Tax=Anolis carolinensis TaxID=28377 RepID=UPI002F2B269A
MAENASNPEGKKERPETPCQRNNNCKENDLSHASEEGAVSLEKAFSVHKEISEITVHCGIPGCNWSGSLKNLEEHQRLCEYTPISCHFGCGLVAIRKQLDQHLQDCCLKDLGVMPAREEGCPFASIGCFFMGPAEERKAHEADATGAHLQLLLQYVKELKAGLFPTREAWFTGSDVWTGLCFNTMPLHPEKKKTPWLGLGEPDQGVSLLESKLRVFEGIASVLSKEMAVSRQKSAAVRGQRGLDQDMIRGLELKMADLQRCLVQKDAALCKLEERLHSSEEISYDGSFLWRITDVHRKCYEAVCGKMRSFQSPAFYTSRYGHKLCMRIYLNGDGRSKGSHASLFLVLLRGEYDALLQWPFAHEVTFMLLSQNNTENHVCTIHPDPASPSFQRPMTDMNEATGFPKFILLAKLQSPKYAYLKEGTLFLRCVTQAPP